MTLNGTIAQVYLTDVVARCDKLYDYIVPNGLLGSISPGSFVVVPFGGGNRSAAALVMALTDRSDVPPEKRKEILRPMDSLLTLDEEFIGRGEESGLGGGLLRFMMTQTFCTPGEALRTILPAPMMGRITETYRAVTPPDAPSPLYDSIAAGKAPDLASAPVRAALRALLDGGFVKKEIVCQGTKKRTAETACLTVPPGTAMRYIDGDRKLRGGKARELLRLLINTPRAGTDALKFELKTETIRAQLDRLVSLGLVRIENSEEYRDPYASLPEVPTDDNTLSPEQQAAADKLLAMADSGEARAALLYGVTGSGKTRVIKRVLDEVLASGRGAIVLVPEIGLTPQTVAFFKSYYGQRVVVTHSGLSDGERFDAWRRLKSGEADICIGTRSAVFAPVRNLGLIVIDEEHEHTYKSDSAPRYHARDIARFRCAFHSALLLLASATPSPESVLKCNPILPDLQPHDYTDPNDRPAPPVSLFTPRPKEYTPDGKEIRRRGYEPVTLLTRYAGSLPETVIADTRLDLREGFAGVIGRRLRAELADNLSKGEQSILFLNRRGYNNFLRCPSCGQVRMCPDCSVALSYHAAGINRGLLCCHYCGHRETPPPVCPECGGTLSYQGVGTQKAEEELNELFPEARILRMDADTTAAKFSADAILDTFRQGGGDILLGTQMVAKGHDFPRVTLVGVLSADMSLYVDDYRANELTFSLLTQVIGRAGRAGNRGRAVIQTFSPDHPVIRMAAAQDYEEFCRNELAFRRAFVFPPFCDLVAITFSSADEVAAARAAAASASVLRGGLAAVQPECTVFGPMESPLYRLKDRYRMRILLKCRLDAPLRALLRRAAAPTPEVAVAIDVNPNTM